MTTANKVRIAIVIISVMWGAAWSLSELMEINIYNSLSMAEQHKYIQSKEHWTGEFHWSSVLMPLSSMIVLLLITYIKTAIVYVSVGVKNMTR